MRWWLAWLLRTSDEHGDLVPGACGGGAMQVWDAVGARASTRDLASSRAIQSRVGSWAPPSIIPSNVGIIQ